MQELRKPPTSNDPTRENSLRVIHLMTCILSSGFGAYNVGRRFSTSELLIFGTAWLCLVILPPALFRLKASYLKTSMSLIVPVIFMLFFVLCTNGGLEASELFWLSAIPLVMGVLLGNAGVWWGATITALLVTLLAFGHYGELGGFSQISPTILEHLVSFLGFLFLTGFITWDFFEHQQRNVQTLVAKNSNIENLLRVLIHDIANNLTSMTYNLIKAKEASSENTISNPKLERVERAVEEISNLLSQVRHLKSIKDGKATLPLKPLSLNLILHEAYEKSQILAQRKGVRLAWNIAQERMMIQGEQAILSNVVLQNLLSNAIKFSFPGEYVELRAYLQHKRIIIEIQDYGIGIPPDLQARLFELNSPTNRLGTQGEKGTGYGMPLVKEYLEMMNGTIQVNSREVAERDTPRGTKIILTLPLFEEPMTQ